jgi:hypothetical protein
VSFQKERIIQDQAERLKAFETKQQQSDLQMAEILKRQDQQIKDHISQIQALQRLIDDMSVPEEQNQFLPQISHLFTQDFWTSSMSTPRNAAPSGGAQLPMIWIGSAAREALSNHDAVSSVRCVCIPNSWPD